MRTIVARESTDGGVEELSDSLTRPLSAEARTVRVVVHEGDLLGGLVRRVEVPLIVDINGSDSTEINREILT